MKYSGILFVALIAYASAIASEVCPSSYKELNDFSSFEVPNRVALSIATKEKWIFPGTYWCGNGNNAPTEDSLGFFKNTDKCCRTHAHCQDVINGHECKEDLCNENDYPVKNCACDCQLKKCLTELNDAVSKTVGMLYFTYLDLDCYKKDYPIIGCKNTTEIMHHKCLEYELDETQEKKLQFFDLPNYIPDYH